MKSSSNECTTRTLRTYTLSAKTWVRCAKTLLLFSLMIMGYVSSAEFIHSPIRTVEAASQAFDYATIIVMENNGFCDIITSTLGGCSSGGSATYLTSLAYNQSIATHYTATTHPSEPNYMALDGGDTYVSGDGNCCWQISSANIIDRVEASGRTWKAFAEDATGSGTCNVMPPRAADHFPFLEFSDMNSASRCANLLTTASPADQEFLDALNSPNPPNLLWLTPNDQDNMHSSSVSTGDDYLRNLVPKILRSQTFTTKNAALFVVFDEGSDSCSSGPSGDCVYAVWAGPVVKKGYSSNTLYDHYSFLKTMETVWNMPSLSSNDQSSQAMTEFFQGSGPSSSPLSSPSSNQPLGSWTWIMISASILATLGLVTVTVVSSRGDRTREPRRHKHST